MNLIVFCQAINLNIINSVLHIIVNLVSLSVTISMIIFSHGKGGVGWVSHFTRGMQVIEFAGWVNHLSG